MPGGGCALSSLALLLLAPLVLALPVLALLLLGQLAIRARTARERLGGSEYSEREDAKEREEFVQMCAHGG